MPLPTPRSTLTQAPARAGVGLRWRILRGKTSRPPQEWPDDWWQRNYDLLLEPNAPDPFPLLPRQKQIPNFPYPT